MGYHDRVLSHAYLVRTKGNAFALMRHALDTHEEVEICTICRKPHTIAPSACRVCHQRTHAECGVVRSRPNEVSETEAAFLCRSCYHRGE